MIAWIPNFSRALLLLVCIAILSVLVIQHTSSSHTIIYLANFLLFCAILMWRFGITGKRKQGSTDTDEGQEAEQIRAALNFQGLGKLDTAYSIFKKCQPSDKLVKHLSYLAKDYEVIGNNDKAKKVYNYILRLQPEYIEVDNTTETAEPTELQPAKKPKPKTIVKRYLPLKNLGKGSRSSVFLAKDLANNSKLVALKLLEINFDKRSDVETELFARFLREAKTAASLEHENIIQILDSGHSSSMAYIAMEFVNGKSLREYSEPDSLLPAELVFLLTAQCADGLHYAHNKGIIHRDVKPANIIFDKHRNIAKLGDFGIARIANSTQTLAGSLLGTPFYMSPEQLVGLELDARSDVFSLGATIFRLLTGTTPFVGGSMAELMRAIVNEPHKNLRLIRPDLDPKVAEVIDTALCKDPKRRYASAAELAEQLRYCEQFTARRAG